MITPDIKAIHKILKKHALDYDVPVVDLIKIQSADPFKILIGTILSARTKDETTSSACKRLFSRAGDIEELENMSLKDIEELIYPVGFYKNKAGYLKKLPEVLKEEFDGKIPETVEHLVKLPGVGRKTANLVAAIAFNKHAICVDTHVHRIMNRVGYVKTSMPLETEMALRKKLPKRYWRTINSFFVAFGQNICRPISPHCSVCPTRQYCNQIGVEKSR